MIHTGSAACLGFGAGPVTQQVSRCKTRESIPRQHGERLYARSIMATSTLLPRTEPTAATQAVIPPAPRPRPPSAWLGDRSTPHRVGRLLTLAFGTTAAMWIIGYWCKMPAIGVPPAVTGVLMLVLLTAGGFVAGRVGRTWRLAALAGLLCGLLNLLILGSLVSGDGGQPHPGAMLWVPGWLLLSAGLGALGALLGAARTPAATDLPDAHISAGSPARPVLADDGPADPVLRYTDWPMAFCVVGVVATFALITTGGIVTGARAGLAVPDWPGTFGSNMFLYPLSRMTSNQPVFFEHAHRLKGALVGLTTISLAAYLFVAVGRTPVRVLGVLCSLAVILQGVLGGHRVTLANWIDTSSGIAIATGSDETWGSLSLGVAHGVLGQLFLAGLLALAIITSARWAKAPTRQPHANGSADIAISTIALLSVALALLFGALQRHFGSHPEFSSPGTLLIGHLTVALLAAMACVGAGVRAWSWADQAPRQRRLGIAVLHTVGLQVFLGFIAASVINLPEADDGTPHIFDIAFTTLHQVTGAILLCLTVALLLSSIRLPGGPSSPLQPNVPGRRQPLAAHDAAHDAALEPVGVGSRG